MPTPSAFPIQLHDATVVVTRPAGSQAVFARQVRKAGGRPVLLPGLALLGPENRDAARRGLQDAQEFEFVVFVSPAAVRFAWRLQPDLHFATSTQIAAVGAATAAALRRRGCVEVLVPIEQHNSDGLLALPPLQELRGKRVALIGAPGGRDTLPDTLQRRGARLERVDVYRRVAPHWTRRHYAALDLAPRPWLVLVSSAEILGHLATGLPPGLYLALRDCELVVSSDRLAGLAAQHGFRHVHVAASALVDDLLVAAAAAVARHRL